MTPPDLLLFDIGNTTVKVGLANAGSVVDSYVLRTDTDRTADDLGLTLLSLLRHAGVAPESIAACLAVSVVPGMNPILRECVARYLRRPLAFVPEDRPVPLENRYEKPSEVGADRLVGAWAARMLAPDAPSLIVADFGTAVTFDCVEGGAYLGGLIFPGPQTALAALVRGTARLPRVSLDVDAAEPVIGRSTAESIRHGLLFGFAAMTEGLIARLSRQLAGETVVLATGGFAASVAGAGATFDAIHPSLPLEGLRRLHQQ